MPIPAASSGNPSNPSLEKIRIVEPKKEEHPNSQARSERRSQNQFFFMWSLFVLPVESVQRRFTDSISRSRGDHCRLYTKGRLFSGSLRAFGCTFVSSASNGWVPSPKKKHTRTQDPTCLGRLFMAVCFPDLIWGVHENTQPPDPGTTTRGSPSLAPS